MSLPICLLILSNQIVHLLAFPIQSSFSIQNNCSTILDPHFNKKILPPESYKYDEPPTINSVRPSSIQNPNVTLEIHIKDAKTVLATNDLFISWEWSDGLLRDVRLAKRSKQIRINLPLTDSGLGKIYIDLEFEKDTTGACDSDNSSFWDGFCPLWKRQTYYYVQLVEKNECKYTSAKSEKHGRMLRPCPAGTYMRVFNNDTWFNPTHEGLNKLHYEGISADAFLDFSNRPDEHNAEDATTCEPCDINRGLNCLKGSAGFHGGQNIKAGYWKVNYATKAEFATAKCKTPFVCLKGGQCKPGTNRNGTLCEQCNDGFGLRNSKCVSCDDQDYTPMLIIAGIALVFILAVVYFRRKLNKLRHLWRDVIRISKVIVDSSQILAAMPSVLGEIEWPDNLLAMLRYLDLSSLDFTQYIGMSCYGGKQISYYSKATVLLVFVSVTTLILFLVYKLAIFQRRKWWDSPRTQVDEKETFTRNVLSDVFDIADYDDSGTLDEQEIKAVVRKMTRNKKATNKIVLAFRSEGMENMPRPVFIKFMIRSQENGIIEIGPLVLRANKAAKRRGILTLITPFVLVLHTPITAKVFALFTCDRIGGKALQTGGRMLRSMDITAPLTMGFLKIDYGANCFNFYESRIEIILFYVFAFLFLIVVTVGFPIVLAIYMRSKKLNFYTYEIWSEIGFIYERFHRGAEFTDLHILCYKTLLCAGIVLLQDWPAMQRSVGAAICVTYLTWFAYLKPMRNHIVNKVCLYGIALTSFFYVSAGIFAAGSQTEPLVRDFFSWLMMICTAGLFVAGALAVYYSIKVAATHTTQADSTGKSKDLRKSLTAIAPVDISKLSSAGMERELRRLHKENKELHVKIEEMEGEAGGDSAVYM